MILGLAVNQSFGYELVLYLHVLCAIVGFGSSFVWPIMSVKARELPPEQGIVINRAVFATAKVVTSPFTIATGLLGVVLVVMSDSAYGMGQPWVSLSLTLWLAAVGIALGLHVPNLSAMLALQEEMVAAGPPQGGPPPQVAELQERGKKAQMYGGILHLLFALILIAMVFLAEIDLPS